ncbi:D-sedoheptulose-7-phosphate isomerase [Salinactinospora qingdaonensis]|uniref:SIS domain-containing protein n=1 Tax=Salinactinospora qingdaonensis TaxID=702744 RepID=A0ABP7FBC1_9ACTN
MTSDSLPGHAEDGHGLYPFLNGGTGRDLDSVMAEVRRSTVDKAMEIVALRRDIGAECGDEVARCAIAMAGRFAAGARLYVFGNGGSSTDAVDVATTFLHPPRGPALPALSLTGDVALVTALSNDVGFEAVFSRQIAALARPGDIAMGLSTSGGSANVVAALAEAGHRGLLTVGLAGYKGGRFAELDSIDHLFVVPSSSVHRIQEAQTTIYHLLWEMTARALEATPRREDVAGGGGVSIGEVSA